MSYLGGIPVKHLDQRLDQRFITKVYEPNFTTQRDAYIHWSAGCRDQDDTVYHIMINQFAPNEKPLPGFKTFLRLSDGSVVGWIENDDIMTTLLRHTSGRNHLGYAMCFASMYQGDEHDLGYQAPTFPMVQCAIERLAQIHNNHKIQVKKILGHGEAADNRDYSLAPYDPDAPGLPPYGPDTTCERWDNHCLIDRRTGKLYAPLQTHPTLYRDQATPPPEDKPNDVLWLMDYIRWETLIRIQKLNERLWLPN